MGIEKAMQFRSREEVEKSIKAVDSGTYNIVDAMLYFMASDNEAMHEYFRKKSVEQHKAYEESIKGTSILDRMAEAHRAKRNAHIIGKEVAESQASERSSEQDGPEL